MSVQIEALKGETLGKSSALAAEQQTLELLNEEKAKRETSEKQAKQEMEKCVNPVRIFFGVSFD